MHIVDIIVRLGFGGVVFILTLLLIKSISGYFKRRVHSDQGPGAAVKFAGAVQKERREDRRVDITLPVKIKTSRGTIEAETRNISIGGAFICCHKPLPLGDDFRLTINAPNQDPLTVEAEVVWSNINVPDEKIVNRGMGVRFIRITGDDRESLKKAISAGLETNVG